MIDRAAVLAGEGRKRLNYISLILSLNVAGFVYYFYYSIDSGYLPSPFIYDKSNTLMDLFNVLYWTYDDGRYTEWGSVYPPLNFIFLRIFNYIFAGSVFGDAALMREHSQFVVVGLGLMYLAIPAFILRLAYWRDFTRNEKVLIYFAIVLSTPLLFALERGNLILLAPLILALAIAQIGVARSVSIALLINLKPYFALLVLYYMGRNNWKGLVRCSVLSGIIFAASGLVLDSQFLEFFRNLFSFSREDNLFSLREVMALPSSISAVSYVLKHPDGAMYVSEVLSSGQVQILVYVIEAVKWSALVVALAALFLRARQMRDEEMFALLVVAISNLGIWVGGYTYVLYIALIPAFMKLRIKWLYIGLLAMIAMPLDVIPITSASIGTQHSYLADAPIEIVWTMGLGSVIRPIVNMVLLVMLSCEFLGRQREMSGNDELRQLGPSISYGVEKGK